MTPSGVEQVSMIARAAAFSGEPDDDAFER